MSRDKLIQVATNFIAWVSKPVDAEALSEFISKDVKVPICYPGTTPDYAGLLAMTQAAHVAAPDLKITIKDMVVDEVASAVVILIDITGTHVKYLPNTSYQVNNSEWLGIPGTGKTFNTLDFVMIKVLI
jgi:hypothetical protein